MAVRTQCNNPSIKKPQQNNVRRFQLVTVKGVKFRNAQHFTAKDCSAYEQAGIPPLVDCPRLPFVSGVFLCPASVTRARAMPWRRLKRMRVKYGSLPGRKNTKSIGK
jgi:hypothetical protein